MYCGSPVFDPQGRLVGIGDGGLEKGASNVSWIIPAKYLAELESSTVSSLPANFAELSQLFSAKSIVDTPVENIEEYVSEPSPEYVPLDAGDFEFYLTKNRSLIEMVETSDDPDNLVKFATELEDMNVTLNYDNLRFDIYEDINNGVVLAVPEGKELYYYEEGGYFAMNYPENNLVGLMYLGSKADYSTTNFEDLTVEVQDWANTTIAQLYGVSGFTTDNDYSYWLDFEGGRKIAWISMLGNEPLLGADGSTQAIGLYLTLLMSDEKTFLAVSSFLVPVELLTYAQEYGLDCVNPLYYEQCEYFESLIKVFCAAHLTTFAY